jgi:type I restriction enzyme S subunit
MRGWALVQLRHIASLAYGSSLAEHDREDGPVQVYGSNGPIGTHSFANTRGPVIVVGRKGSFGKLQYCKDPVFAIDTTYFVDATKTQCDLRWLYYAMHSLRLDHLSEDVGVPGLSREHAYAQRLRLPPASSQRAIADYLDRETARIDRLVAAKRRMIELLEQHLMNRIEEVVWHAVETVPLMHRTQQSRPIMYGIVLPGPNVEVGVPIVKGGDVRAKRLTSSGWTSTSPTSCCSTSSRRTGPATKIWRLRHRTTRSRILGLSSARSSSRQS